MAPPTQPSSFALRGIALFEGLGSASLDRIAADCEWRPLQARQPVFSRCSTGSDVFFLVSGRVRITTDRKSTRLNSSHLVISYAVFCLKKKKKKKETSQYCTRRICARDT